MGAEVLVVDRISKSYADRSAVSDVSFRVGEGETYGLLGPNGAGKSTTISIVAGLMVPDSGTVSVMGREVTPRTTAARAAIGLVPQDVAVYQDLTGRENLRFFGRLYDLRDATLDDRIDEVLEIIGLADRADDAAGEYSGGMQRRLNIGIGLLHRPRLLILDEPTVGVDPQSRNAILGAVERLSVEGMAVLYTTHYMEEAERLCDRIGIIDEGEVRAEGTRRELTTIVGQRDRLRIAATGGLSTVAEDLGRIEGVVSVTESERGLELLVDDATASVALVLDVVGAAGITVTAVEVDQPDLEAVFLHLTGKALRD